MNRVIWQEQLYHLTNQFRTRFRIRPDVVALKIKVGRLYSWHVSHCDSSIFRGNFKSAAYFPFWRLRIHSRFMNTFIHDACHWHSFSGRHPHPLLESPDSTVRTRKQHYIDHVTTAKSCHLLCFSTSPTSPSLFLLRGVFRGCRALHGESHNVVSSQLQFTSASRRQI